MTTCASVTIAITPTTIIALVNEPATVTPTNPKVGDTVYISGRLYNSGNTAGSVKVGVRYNGALLSGSVTYSVGAGLHQAVALTFTASGTVGTPYPACLEIVP
jgi:hypothetical protein